MYVTCSPSSSESSCSSLSSHFFRVKPRMTAGSTAGIYFRNSQQGSLCTVFALASAAAFGPACGLCSQRRSCASTSCTSAPSKAPQYSHSNSSGPFISEG